MADLKRLVEILISSKFDAKGTKSAATEMDKIAKATASFGTGLALGGVAVVGTLTGIAVAAAKTADDLRDLSLRTGIQVDLLSQLKFAAEQTGTNINELGDGMKFLLKNASEAAGGSKEAQEKFDRLGISSKQLGVLLRDPKALLLAVADGMQGVEGQAGRTAAQIDLFGRSGTKLNEFLSGGSAQIEALRAEAERLGLTLTKEAAEGADKFRDAQAKAKATTEAFSQAVSTALLPRLTEMVNGLGEVIAKSAEFVRQHPELVRMATEFGAYAVVGGTAISVIANVVVSVAGLITVLKAGAVHWTGFWAAATGPAGIVAAIAAGLLVLSNRTDELTKKIRAAGQLPSQQPGNAADASGAPGGKPIVAGYDPLASAIGALQTSGINDPRDRLLPVTVGMKGAAVAATDLEATIKSLEETLAKLQEPGKVKDLQDQIRDLRREAEQAKRPLADIIIENAGNLPPAEKLKARKRTEEGSSFVPEPITLVDPLAPTQFEENIARSKEALGELHDVGTSAILGIADSLTGVLGSALAGTASGFKNVGDFARQMLASVAAQIAGLILQVVALNAALAIFSPGSFKGLFSGIGKVFGLQKGGLALASGGLVGGPGGIDQAGPVMLNRGELVTPAPVTARLSSFLEKALQGGQLATAGGGNTYHLNIATGAFYSKSEELGIMQRIRDGLEELEGRRR